MEMIATAVLAGAAVLLFVFFNRIKFSAMVRAMGPPVKNSNEKPDRPQSFGYKCTWWAFRTDDPVGLVAALRLKNATTSSWQKGIEAAYQDQIFVTPCINGWVFVISSAFPPIEHEETRNYWEVLARYFPQAQCFATHRVSEYHGWLRYEKGRCVRAFAYANGAPLLDAGEKTAEEKALGQEFFNGESPEAQEESYWDRTDLTYPDEDYVMQLAGQWSINPQEIEKMNLPLSLGYRGDFNRAVS